MNLTDHHFLKIADGKIVLWDYRAHAQFELSPEHFIRLLQVSAGEALTDTVVDREIRESGVLTLESSLHSRWGWDWLSHIFHYGTCHPLSPSAEEEQTPEDYARSYAQFCASIANSEPEVEILKGGARVELPCPSVDRFESVSLWTALRSRRTCRDFNGKPISLRELSDLLFATFGDMRVGDPSPVPGISPYGFRRTSPCAGGLQCTEPYIWALNVDGLPSGIYHYLSQKHQLELVRKELPEHRLSVYLCNQHWADDLAVAFIMTARFDKMWWKYPHSRAYRPMLMEIGHFSQTLNLCITASGMSPWITGYFHDSELAQLLGCESELEHPLLLVGAGHSDTRSGYDRAARSIAEKTASEGR